MPGDENILLYDFINVVEFKLFVLVKTRWRKGLCFLEKYIDEITLAIGHLLFIPNNSGY